jgi:hypothetical protein
MIHRLLMLAGTCILAGCSTTSGLQASSTRSGFDGSRVVNITPHGAACTRVLCTGLGAQWRSNRPDRAYLAVVVFNEYAAITGAQLNIDGTVHTLSSTSSTDFSPPGTVGVRESRRDFDVPIATLRAIAASKRTWLRVVTPSGALEDAVLDGSTDSKAYHALKRFLAEVDAGA